METEGTSEDDLEPDVDYEIHSSNMSAGELASANARALVSSSTKEAHSIASAMEAELKASSLEGVALGSGGSSLAALSALPPVALSALPPVSTSTPTRKIG